MYHGTTEFHGTHQHDLLQLGDNEQKAYGPGKTPSDIFPEYYLIKVNQFNERIKDKFDEWVYFLKTEKIQPTFSAQGIESAAKKLNILSLTEEEQRAYERYEENSHYEASMHESHYGRGKADGKAEGKAEGEAIGIEKGKAEAKKELARTLLKEGVFLSIIQLATQLSKEEIESL